MIELKIDELIAALDRNTQALSAFLTPNLPPAKTQSAPSAPAPEASDSKPKKSAKTAEPAMVGEPTVTLDTLRELGDKLIKAGKQPAIYTLVRKFGAENLRTLESKHYNAVQKELLAELLREGTPVAPAAPVAPVVTETAPVKPVEPPKPEPEVTLEALKTYALSLVEQGCAQSIGKLAQKYGKKRLSEIPESAYVEAFAALKDIEADLPEAA
jgi:hypothetical protein